MELIKTWNENFYIGAYDVDTRSQIKLSRLTGYMQETAWWHASHLGFGADFLNKNNMVWMLSAIKLYVNRYPKWTEKISVESWPKGLKKFYYLRDFVLKDQEENQFGIASTQWLLLDIGSKRPKTVETDILLAVKNENRNVFEDTLDKLPKVVNGEKFTRYIDYTDYDLNLHVNSNRYIDFVLGTFSNEFLKWKKVTDFQINYLKEIKDVESIVLRKKQVNTLDMFFIEGLSMDEKLTYFQSFVGFDQNR